MIMIVFEKLNEECITSEYWEEKKIDKNDEIIEVNIISQFIPNWNLAAIERV